MRGYGQSTFSQLSGEEDWVDDSSYSSIHALSVAYPFSHSSTTCLWLWLLLVVQISFSGMKEAPQLGIQPFERISWSVSMSAFPKRLELQMPIGDSRGLRIMESSIMMEWGTQLVMLDMTTWLSEQEEKPSWNGNKFASHLKETKLQHCTSTSWWLWVFVSSYIANEPIFCC